MVVKGAFSGSRQPGLLARLHHFTSSVPVANFTDSSVLCPSHLPKGITTTEPSS